MNKLIVALLMSSFVTTAYAISYKIFGTDKACKNVEISFNPVDATIVQQK